MNDHFSFSQFNMYLNCGESYRRRYIEKEIIPPGIALVRGSATHKGIEINHRQKQSTHEDLPKKHIIDISVEDFDNRIRRDGIKNDEDKPDKDVVGEGRDQTAALAGLYAEKVAPEIQPVYVEERIVIDIPDLKPIYAVMDCLDDKNNVRDFKTAGKSKSQSDIDTSLQFSIYALAAKEKTGKMPDNMYMDVLVATKEPKYQRLVTKRAEDSYIQVIRLASAVQSAIQKGVFLPATPGAWNCSARWCGYYTTCPYVQNKIFMR